MPSNKAREIYEMVQDAGADGVSIIDIAHHYGVSASNIDVTLASFESKGIKVAELDNRLYTLDALVEPEILFNRDYDYFVNRIR